MIVIIFTSIILGVVIITFMSFEVLSINTMVELYSTPVEYEKRMMKLKKTRPFLFVVSKIVKSWVMLTNWMLISQYKTEVNNWKKHKKQYDPFPAFLRAKRTQLTVFPIVSVVIIISIMPSIKDLYEILLIVVPLIIINSWLFFKYSIIEKKLGRNKHCRT